MTQISIRLPDGLLDAIDDHARETGSNRSELIRETLESRFVGQSGDGVSRRDANNSGDTVDRETYEKVRSERDRLEGQLDIKDDLLEAKDAELERLSNQYETLDARLSESQQALSHVNQQRSQEVERYEEPEEQRGFLSRLFGR